MPQLICENDMSTKKRITIKGILKFIAFSLIALVYILLIGRMMLAKPRGDMARYLWTDEAVNIYNESKDDYLIETAYLKEIIDGDTGYYSISDFTMVKSTGEVQLTVRYNNSTLKKLDELYPDRVDSDEDFVFALKDDNGNIYTGYKYKSSSNFLYNFRRVVFDNIELNNDSSLYFCVYYTGDIKADAPMTRSYELIDKDQINESGYIRESKTKVNLKNPTAHKLIQSPEYIITD